MVMTHIQAKHPGQRSIRSKDRMQTSEQTDRQTNKTDRITFHDNAVNNNSDV